MLLALPIPARSVKLARLGVIRPGRLRWPSESVAAIFGGHMFDLTVPPAAAGHRLDRFLADALAHLSRSRVQALIREGHVQLNRRPASKPAEALRPADIVSWEEPPAVTSTVMAETLDLSILHEDDDLIVINKAAGMVTHPAPGHDAGTLVNALLAHCPTLSGIGGERRPGIVHRLDKDTSGCLVVAKNDFAHRALSAQFADRSTVKRYLAIVRGVPRPSRAQLTSPSDATRSTANAWPLSVTPTAARPGRTTVCADRSSCGRP